METVEDRKKKLMDILNNCDTPREKLHDLFKEKLKAILVDGIIEFMDYLDTGPAKQEFHDDLTVDERYANFEKWVGRYIDDHVKRGD